MKEYNFRLVIWSLKLTFFSLLFILVLALRISPILATTFAALAFILVNVWLSSDVPKQLLKDITTKFDKKIGFVMFFFFNMGIELTTGITLMYAAEPILGPLRDAHVWPVYSFYFLLWYALPLVLLTSILTRAVVSCRGIFDLK